MSAISIGQIVFYAVALVALGLPLGLFMARVYSAEGGVFTRRFGLGALERGFYRIVRADPAREQDWKSYAKSVVVFSAVFSLVLYALLRLQSHLFLNPDGLPGVPSHISLNTTASFVTNTNWQYYGGEYTMSYLSQMAGLAVQNFVSAAVGMAVLVAVIRGFTRRSSKTLGNFWQDLYRSLAYILAPALGRAGDRADLAGRAADVRRRRDGDDARGRRAVDRARPGRVAGRDQAARDERRRLLQLELGRAVREPERAHELPRGALDPADPGRPGLHVREAGRSAEAGLRGLRGHVRDVRDRRGGDHAARAAGLPGAAATSGVDLDAGDGQSGGNMADKEVRFGIANTSLWAVATTNASNGSVNGGHDALTAGGGAVPILNMFTGEVIFGGVGSGLYGMVFYIVIAVFVAGLMVGRTPEYLGKKIEAREVKIAAVGALFVPTMVLIMVAVSVVTDVGLASIFNPGAHGFSEAFYAYDSQGNNNGSAFAGYGATDFSARFGTVALYLGRFAPLIAALALAGSLGGKKIVPASAGTFRTDGPTFSFLLSPSSS